MKTIFGVAFGALVAAACGPSEGTASTIQQRCMEVDLVTGGCAVGQASCGLPSLGGIDWAWAPLGLAPGERYRVECPASGSPEPVWGTNYYTTDSSLCTAAVHAGLITYDVGGFVTFEVLEGQTSYCASDANGVSSRSWDAYDRSFHFPEAVDASSACPRPVGACRGVCDSCDEGLAICLFPGSSAEFWEGCSLFIERPSCDGVSWATGTILEDEENSSVFLCEVRRVPMGDPGPGWAVDPPTDTCGGGPATRLVGLEDELRMPGQTRLHVVCP